MILETFPLGFPFRTFDPFLFCVHHLDHYPRGNDRLGPDVPLTGRNLGMDFEVKDGFRMYHGDVVPGFPRHPHRGFETITLARQGHLDHADSLGAKARFGNGDVQWMTAGSGIVHSEMFPCLNSDAPNTAELFQIWLNLPKKSKMVDPYFTMIWNEDIPRQVETDEQGRKGELVMLAGGIGDAQAPAPPPDSWANQPGSDVAVWTVNLDAGASLVLPAGSADATRTVYIFEGSVTAAGETRSDCGVRVRSDQALKLRALDAPARVLMLQGKPIGEPVAHHGPFVMNRPEEIVQAIRDYQRTGFGGWPHGEDAPVHGAEKQRFAVHADGREERR